jgi:hypothetical protein
VTASETKAKLKGSAIEEILKKVGGAFGDKGFVATDYITTPIRKPTCRKLLEWEREWNSRVSSFRAPVEPSPHSRNGESSSPTIAGH